MEQKVSEDFSEKLNQSISSCDNMIASLSSTQKQLAELTLYQQALQEKTKFIREDFFNSIRKNDVNKVQEYFDWGIENIPDLLVLKDKPRQLWSSHGKLEKETVFNTNSNLNLVEQDMRELLILRSPVRLQPYFEELLVRRLNENINSKYSNINTYDVNLLQWTLVNKPELFKKHLEKQVFDGWGRIPFDTETHETLHQYVLDHHPNIIQTFSNVNFYGRTHNMTVEEFYKLEPYRKTIDQLSVSQLGEMGQKELIIAFQKGNPSAMNFWLSFYITFPTEKKHFSTFIAECHKHDNFIEALDVVLNNVNIDIHNHIMLRAAISNGHEKTVSHLLMNYASNKLPEVQEVFSNKDSQNKSVPQSHKDMLTRLLNYHKLQQELSQNTPAKAKRKL